MSMLRNLQVRWDDQSQYHHRMTSVFVGSRLVMVLPPPACWNRGRQNWWKTMSGEISRAMRCTWKASYKFYFFWGPHTRPAAKARLCFFNDASHGVKELHDVSVDAIYTGSDKHPLYGKLQFKTKWIVLMARQWNIPFGEGPVKGVLIIQFQEWIEDIWESRTARWGQEYKIRCADLDLEVIPHKILTSLLQVVDRVGL